MDEKTKNKTRKRRGRPPRRPDAGRFPEALLDALVQGAETTGDLFGPDSAFAELKGALMQRLLDAELEAHLEAQEAEASEEEAEAKAERNRRNGYSAKTVHTESGPVPIQVPRDRQGGFEPRLVKKHQRRIEGFDEKVIALYARGMTTRDIAAHLEELYGTEVSPQLISRATESVMADCRAWQGRPLDTVYPIVYLDALFISVRDGGQVSKHAFYVAMGVGLDGQRDVLGLWAAKTEGAKFWLEVLTQLKGRGVEDILFICADGLKGLPQAIEAAFPKAVHQTCVVHLLRRALRFVSWADRKALAKALKAVYTAPDAEAAEAALAEVDAQWGAKYPSVARTFRDRWADFIPFLGYPPQIRKMLYTTNAIESLNAQLRKALRQRGVFPSEDAALKLLYLAIQNAKLRFGRPTDWSQTLAQLDIYFEGRLPA